MFIGNLWEPKATTKDASLHPQLIQIGVEVLLSQNIESQLFDIGAITI